MKKSITQRAGKAVFLFAIVILSASIVSEKASAQIFSGMPQDQAESSKKAPYEQLASGFFSRNKKSSNSTYQGYQQKAENSGLSEAELKKIAQIEAQEAQHLQARQAAREQRVNKLVEEQQKLVKKLEEESEAATQKRLEEREQRLEDYKEKAAEYREKSRHNTHDDGDSEKVRRIYKTPEESDEPSRVFKNFR